MRSTIYVLLSEERVPSESHKKSGGFVTVVISARTTPQMVRWSLDVRSVPFELSPSSDPLNESAAS
jgi:hypothetical protein